MAEHLNKHLIKTHLEKGNLNLLGICAGFFSVVKGYQGEGPVISGLEGTESVAVAKDKHKIKRPITEVTLKVSETFRDAAGEAGLPNIPYGGFLTSAFAGGPNLKAKISNGAWEAKHSDLPLQPHLEFDNQLGGKAASVYCADYPVGIDDVHNRIYLFSPHLECGVHKGCIDGLLDLDEVKGNIEVLIRQDPAQIYLLQIINWLTELESGSVVSRRRLALGELPVSMLVLGIVASLLLLGHL